MALRQRDGAAIDPPVVKVSAIVERRRTADAVPVAQDAHVIDVVIADGSSVGRGPAVGVVHFAAHT